MDSHEAARVLISGGVIIYPTETLYALGCALLPPGQAEACARVAALKGRPETKPFPLILADLDGLWRILGDLPAALADDLGLLARSFWPGPLSVLLPTRPDLPALVRDAQGQSSVRLSPHPVARELCLLTGAALVATSANKSGQPPASRPEGLDPALLRDADAALLGQPWPGGGAASTLVRLLGGGRLALLRAGAVPAATLAQTFAVEAASPGAPAV